MLLPSATRGFMTLDSNLLDSNQYNLKVQFVHLLPDSTPLMLGTCDLLKNLAHGQQSGHPKHSSFQAVRRPHPCQVAW